MPTLSKYVTDEDIANAEQGVADIDGEMKELDLAEKAGANVTEIRKKLQETKDGLLRFISTYKVIEEAPKRGKR